MGGPAFLNPPIRFEVIEDQNGKRCPVLLASPPEWIRGASESFGEFDPAKNRRLFRVFADLDLEDGEALARFASRSGLLFVDQPALDLGESGMESIDEWRWHIRQVRYLVAVRNILLDQPATRRASRFRDLDEQFSTTKPPEEVILASGRRITVGREWPELWRRPGHSRGDPNAHESIWHQERLDTTVSRMLQEHCRLLWRWRAKAVTFHPVNTLGAIYLTLLEELGNEGRPLRQCPGCGKHFRPGRSDQKACGPNCRNRLAYRKRKAAS